MNKSYAVVETDLFGRDDPNEKFAEGTEQGVSHREALDIARKCNRDNSFSHRYWKVVELPYELEGGFQP